MLDAQALVALKCRVDRTIAKSALSQATAEAARHEIKKLFAGHALPGAML